MNRKSQTTPRARSGFTLLELFVVILVLGILLCMLLPATRNIGPAARRTDCANRLRQLAIATHNYHDAHRHLPSAMGNSGIPGGDNQLSGLLTLAPFMELKPVWDEVKQPQVYGGQKFAAGPSPWSTGYEPWQQTYEQLLCPSDTRLSLIHI